MGTIIIMGAGTGGTLMANMLRPRLPNAEWKIIVIDPRTHHIYQPGLIFLPFRLYGYESRTDLERPIRDPLPEDIELVQASVTKIDHQSRRVHTTAGDYDYDWLIGSMGCHIAPETIGGLADSLGKEVFTFYEIDHALKLQKKLDSFSAGHLVLDIAEMPIKCPVAPIEFVFLADYFFTQKGVRDAISITLVTPYSGAFTKPNANEVLSQLASEKNINLVTDFSLERVDIGQQRMHGFDGATLDYDLLVVIPPNFGPSVYQESGLGTDSGWAQTDSRTLKSTIAERVYFLGDNTNVTASKAGSVTHFESETVVENVLREISGKKAVASFDGHANCFIETGHDKAMLIDFSYDMEPLPGKFPMPIAGPFSLLEETHINHFGKLAFKWVYWNMLLPGILPHAPMMPSHMDFLGKDAEQSQWVKRTRARKVSDVMTKGVVAIQQGMPLTDAAQLMVKHCISGLPVINAENIPVGMLTEADLLGAIDFSTDNPLRKALHALFSKRDARKSMGTIVDDLMSQPVISTTDDSSLLDAIKKMDQHKVKRLLIVDDDNKTVGILTRADLVGCYLS